MNPKGVEIRAFAGATTMYLQSDIAPYTPTGTWYKNFMYETSAERGESESEDQYNPGFFATKLDQGYQVSILASLRNQQTFSTEGLRYREMQRLRKLSARFPQIRFVLAYSCRHRGYLPRQEKVHGYEIHPRGVPLVRRLGA